jgi:hypothetical protein
MSLLFLDGLATPVHYWKGNSFLYLTVNHLLLLTMVSNNHCCLVVKVCELKPELTSLSLRTGSTIAKTYPGYPAVLGVLSRSTKALDIQASYKNEEWEFQRS